MLSFVSAIHDMTTEIIQTVQQQGELSRKQLHTLFDGISKKKELTDTIKQTREMIEVCPAKISKYNISFRKYNIQNIY